MNYRIVEMPPVKKATTVTTDESIKLLEASKKWRAELRRIELHEENLEPLVKTVAGALEDLVTTQVGTIEQVKSTGTTAKHAAKGADLAQEIAKKAVNLATENESKFTAAMQSANKRLQEMEIRGKAALSQLQKLELAQSESTIVAKGVGPMTLGRESQEDMRRALNLAFQTLQVGGINIEYTKRLQRVKGDRGVNPPAMKVKLSNVTDKLRLYDAMKRATANGNNITYEFQNEVPRYALNSHKQQHRIAQEIRKIDKNLKTRVSMVKGEAWPQIRIKRRGEPVYKPAPKEFVEIAKQNLIRANKARAAERKAEHDSRILYDEEEEMETAPGPSQAQGPSQAAGPSGLATRSGTSNQSTFGPKFNQFRSNPS